MYSYDPGITAAECNSAAATTCGENNYLTEQDSSSPGVVDTLDFSNGEWQGEMNGGWQDPYCNFTCTGVGSVCPATQPLAFEEISGPGQPLECANANFTGSGYLCQQLADQTCAQTVYTPDNTTVGSSGKVDINGVMHPPPPWVIYPNPGVSIFDFDMGYSGEGAWESHCTFTCTGQGQVCPSGFTQTSSEQELLTCEDHSFIGESAWGNSQVDGMGQCEQIAQSTCINTTGLPSQPFWWFPNPNLNTLESLHQDPTQYMGPAIQFNSIIGPQGETLDTTQFFYNVAVQQLLDQHQQRTNMQVVK
jgi:hypothetical protein